jgi:hypothetical protein
MRASYLGRIAQRSKSDAATLAPPRRLMRSFEVDLPQRAAPHEAPAARVQAPRPGPQAPRPALPELPAEKPKIADPQTGTSRGTPAVAPAEDAGRPEGVLPRVALQRSAHPASTSATRAPQLVPPAEDARAERAPMPAVDSVRARVLAPPMPIARTGGEEPPVTVAAARVRAAAPSSAAATVEPEPAPRPLPRRDQASVPSWTAPPVTKGATPITATPVAPGLPLGPPQLAERRETSAPRSESATVHIGSIEVKVAPAGPAARPPVRRDAGAQRPAAPPAPRTGRPASAPLSRRLSSPFGLGQS